MTAYNEGNTKQFITGKWFEPRGISYWFAVIVRVKTLHLTLKMTTAQVVETSVTNNSLSKDYLNPDNHDKPITIYHWYSDSDIILFR